MNDISTLPAYIQEISRSVDTTNLAILLGQKLVADIKAHAEAGVDIFGQPFQSYAPSYQEKKGTASVNLRVSGAMLESIQVSPTSSGALVMLPDSQIEKATDVEKLREFFGISDAFESSVDQFLINFFGV